MTPTTTNDIESELSYAYLHAVASKARAECGEAKRLSDNHGIDAVLTSWGPFSEEAEQEEVDLKVQLKATLKALIEKDEHYSFSIAVKQLENLCSLNVGTDRLLVVLFLPDDANEWLTVSETSLVIKRCA